MQAIVEESHIPIPPSSLQFYICGEQDIKTLVDNASTQRKVWM